MSGNVSHHKGLTLIPVNPDNVHLVKNVKMSVEQNAFFDSESDLENVALQEIEGRRVLPFLVMSQSEPIGFFRLILSPAEDLCSLSAFVISVEYQGRGYGSECLSKINEMVRDKFPLVSQIGLLVHPENVAAIGLYRKHGFSFTEKWKNGFDTMKKEL